MSDNESKEVKESGITVDTSPAGSITATYVPASARKEEEKKLKKMKPITFVISMSRY